MYLFLTTLFLFTVAVTIIIIAIIKPEALKLKIDPSAADVPETTIGSRIDVQSSNYVIDKNSLNIQPEITMISTLDEKALNGYFGDKNILFPTQMTSILPYKPIKKQNIAFFLGMNYLESYPILMNLQNQVWRGISNVLLTHSAKDALFIDNKLFIIGNGASSITFSNDLKVWYGLGTELMTNAESLAYNGNILVITGQGKNSIIASEDKGLTFIEFNNYLFYKGKKVIWSGEKFIIVGYGTNTIAWSYDGKIWNGLGQIIFTENAFTAFPGGNGIAFNGYIYVATGSGENKLTYSYNGREWYPTKSLFIHVGNSVCWTGKFFIAVGGFYNDDITQYTTIIISYDGINWENAIPEEQQPLFTWMANSVSFDGRNIFVHGISKNNPSITYTSKDGFNWTRLNINYLSETMNSVFL